VIYCYLVRGVLDLIDEMKSRLEAAPTYLLFPEKTGSSIYYRVRPDSIFFSALRATCFLPVVEPTGYLTGIVNKYTKLLLTVIKSYSWLFVVICGYL